jgi:hypothetical protein
MLVKSMLVPLVDACAVADVITLAPMTGVPFIVGLVSVGLVSVLFVSVCVSVVPTTAPAGSVLAESLITLPVVPSNNTTALLVALAGPDTLPPAEVEAIVIEPLPLVMVTPDPAVNVALVRVLPVVLPISNCPFVYVVCPVPPLDTPRVPPSVTAPVVAVFGVNPVVPAEKLKTPAAAAGALVHVVPLDVNKFPFDPGATNKGAEVPFPKITLLAVRVVAAVPPEATGSADPSVNEDRCVTASTTFVPLL